MNLPSAENPEISKILTVRPRVDQNIALHASPTVRNSAFLISTFSFHLTSFFFFFSFFVLSGGV